MAFCHALREFRKPDKRELKQCVMVRRSCTNSSRGESVSLFITTSLQ